MRARFIGDPNDDFSGPKVVPVGDLYFRKDEWTSIPEGWPMLAKLQGNSHFEVDEGNTPVLTQLDHDHDGRPGGSLPVSENDNAERARIRAEIENLGGERPHHATGLARLSELLIEAKAAKEARDFEDGED